MTERSTMTCGRMFVRWVDKQVLLTTKRCTTKAKQQAAYQAVITSSHH